MKYDSISLTRDRALPAWPPDFTTIPIVDLALYSSPDPEVKAKFLKHLADVLLNVGFLYLKGHGVPEDLNKSMFEMAKTACELPREEKAKFSMDLSPSFKGWSELGRETTYGKTDLRETIGLGWENPKAGPDEPIWRNQSGPIPWPPVENFRDVTETYIKTVHKTATTLLSAISETLGKPPSYLAEFFLDETRPPHILQINHYPSIDLSKNPDWLENLGDAAHVDDPMVLTCLNQDMVGGLQVMNFAGEWIDATPIPGTIVVNTGSYLEFLTGGRYVATTHRVRMNTSGTDRYSIPYFLMPRLDMVRIPPAIPEAELPKYVVENAPTVTKRYDELSFNYNVAKNVGEYIFYVKLMKSFPIATQIHYPGFDVSFSSPSLYLERFSNVISINSFSGSPSLESRKRTQRSTCRF